MDRLKSEHVFEECKKIVKDANPSKLLADKGLEAAAKIVNSIKVTEMKGISAYITQIMQFLGFEIQGGEAPYIATAFSIMAKNLLDFCEGIGEKRKCEELWKFCEEYLDCGIQISGKKEARQEDK